jgi:hypothetical protein
MTSYNKNFCTSIFFKNLLNDINEFINNESRQNGLYSIKQEIPVNYEIKMGDYQDNNIVWNFVDTFLQKIGYKTKIPNTPEFFTYYTEKIKLLNSLPYNDPLVNQIEEELNQYKYNLTTTSILLDEYVRFMFRFYNNYLYGPQRTQLPFYILHTLSNKYDKKFNHSCVIDFEIFNDSNKMNFSVNSTEEQPLNDSNLNNFIKKYIQPPINNSNPVIVIPLTIAVTGIPEMKIVSHANMIIIENHKTYITIHHYEPHGTDNGLFYKYSGDFLETFTKLIGSVTNIKTNLNIASSFQGIQYKFRNLDIGFCELISYFWLYVSVLAIYTNKNKNSSITDKYYSKIEECFMHQLSEDDLYELIIRFCYNLIMKFFMENKNNIYSFYKDNLSEFVKIQLADPSALNNNIFYQYDKINSYELYQKLGGPSIVNNKSSSGRLAKSYIPQYSRIKQTIRTRSISPLKIKSRSRSRSYKRDSSKKSDFLNSDKISTVPFSFSKRKSSKIKSRKRKSSKIKSTKKKSRRRRSILRK